MTPLTVLTSGVGLGSYVAALLHQNALRDAGHEVETEVIEGWFTAAAVARHLTHKEAYSQSFRLALAGRQMSGRVTDRLDEARIEPLLDRWRRQRRTRFFVWSGYWLPVLDRYVARAPELRVELELCRIDAIESDSFRVHDEPAAVVSSELWLWSLERHALGGRLAIPAGPPVPFRERSLRLVTHGGGWGLGTYTEVLSELSEAGYALDVLGTTPIDWVGRARGDRRYMPDPDWHPWSRDAAGELTFPPLGEAAGDAVAAYRSEPLFPVAHRLIRDALAVVSKPGGGTLLDSLAAATPVVLLEPWGRPERANGELWQELGFGIGLAQWRARSFDLGVLSELHENLLAAGEECVAAVAGEVTAVPGEVTV